MTYSVSHVTPNHGAELGSLSCCGRGLTCGQFVTVAQKQSCVSDPASASHLISSSHVGMLVHLCRSGAVDEDAGI